MLTVIKKKSSLFLFVTISPQLIVGVISLYNSDCVGLIVMCYVASMAVLYACLGIFQLQLVVPNLPVDPGYTCIGLGI
jgi:hypothetical protein